MFDEVPLEDGPALLAIGVQRDLALKRYLWEKLQKTMDLQCWQVELKMVQGERSKASSSWLQKVKTSAMILIFVFADGVLG